MTFKEARKKFMRAVGNVEAFGIDVDSKDVKELDAIVDELIVWFDRRYPRANLFPTKILPADLHGVTGGNWEQEGGKVVACWGVVHFPDGRTLAGAPYVIHDAPMDMHGAARLAARRNKAQATGSELYLALPLRWDGSDWQLTRVQFAEEGEARAARIGAGRALAEAAREALALQGESDEVTS